MEAVILAAGFSSRAGCFKMELDIKGKPLLQHNIDLFLGICSRVIVVSGYKADRIKKLVQPDLRIEIVHNRSFESGMFSSVLTGVAATRDDFFITPGDFPEISPETLTILAKSSGSIRIPSFKGRKGHPVFMEKEMKALLLKERNEFSLREFIGKTGSCTVSVEDNGVLIDIDTPRDYSRFRQKRN